MGELTDVYRNGFIHVQRRKCDTCIFRPGNLMNLVEGRRDGMVEEAIRDQGCIPCHKNLDAPGQAVCRGFFDEHAPDVSSLQIADRMGFIKEVTLRNKP